MNEFLIELQAKLDEAKSKGNINSDIEKIQEKINKLKLQVEIDPKTISDITKQLEGILNQEIKISNFEVDTEQANKAGQEVGQEFNKGVSKGLSKSSSISATTLAIANNELETFKANAKEFPQLTETVKTLDEAISNVGDATSLNSFNEQLRVAKKELTKVKSELNSINRSEKVNINISDLQSKIAILQRISPEITNFKAQINGAEVTIESLLEDLSKVNTQSDFSVVNSKFRAFTSAAKSAGIATSEFASIIRDQLKQVKNAFVQAFSITAIATTAISKTKEAVSELKEVDTLLTEISKANDKLSKSDLAQIGNNSFDVASKYGKTATDYLTGVQEASRAGYENAEAIAELSVAAQGAGDMTAELANQYIIATDKAYKLSGSVEKLTEILDGSNFITNHNAVNMTELAEGMSVVGAQAASSQMEVNEITAAIGTMVATTQKSGREMGNAFKGILMNLQQVTGDVGDGEDIIDAESLTKYEKACAELGVSLKEVKNGVVSLKEPMQIIKELSEEYNKLDKADAKRANLLNAVGGKIYHVTQKCITRMNLNAGNALEPCATI